MGARASAVKKAGAATKAQGAALAARRASRLGTVITWVETPIVRGAVESNPICLVYPARIASRWTIGKRGRDFDPARLFASNGSDFVGDFRQILILIGTRSIVFLPDSNTSGYF